MKLIEWGKLKWPEIPALVEERKACLLPLGAIEAHGPHLNIDIDNGIVYEKCRRVCERTGLILMPIVNYGVVYSLYGFPGSLTVSFDTMRAIIKDLISSFYDNKFRVVFIHSHHGGNWTVIKQTIREEADKYPEMKLVILNELSAIKEAQKAVCQSQLTDTSMAHADELETSQALECSADDVDMNKAITEYPDFPFDLKNSTYRWTEISEYGIMGDAKAGTKEKGEKIINAEVEAMIKIVNYVLEKYEELSLPKYHGR